MSNATLTRGIAISVGLAVVALFFVYGNPFAAVESGLTGGLQGATGQLGVQDDIPGVGEEAEVGDQLVVHYVGKLSDGTVFDTSVGGSPYTFTLGGGEVIPGWDQGLQGMRVGGKRTLVIPPDLAYGPNGYGPIPPNATLIFEVELVDIVGQ
jgi:FKBP-type peptidyl-prolyl cis-trans isomerase